MHIDRFSILTGSVVVVGWSPTFAPGREIVILVKGQPIPTVTVPVHRPDLAGPYDETAAAWGFRAHGVFVEPAKSGEIGLRLPDGEVIDPVQTTPFRDPHNPYAPWLSFVDHVNAQGGRILEIGARARSSITRRSVFSEAVEYVGFDLMPGENVDIVGDAHHLSRFVDDGFDFIFSISTFEHFLMPWKVALEMNAVLKPGGVCYSQSHQTWPVHDAPWDFFRFSREAWTGLFNVHTGFEIKEAVQGVPLSMLALFNDGGPYDDMDRSLGYGLSACTAVKTGLPTVSWAGEMSEIATADYTH